MAAGATSADLLVDFANTYDVEGPEELGDAGELRAWLTAHGLLTTAAVPARADLELAHALRSGFRAAMAAHHDKVPGGGEELTAAAVEVPLVISFEGLQPRLVATGDPVRRALGGLLVAAHELAAAGRWSRLKLCAAGTCAYAFYDGSKNHSRTWCSMQECGNRQKTKAYRRRQAVAKLSRD